MSHCIEATGEIDAPLALVYQVVAEVAADPEFLPGVQSVTQVGDAIEMTVRLGPIDVSWTSRATFRPHVSIVIQLVDGPFEQMDVRWTFVAKEGKTEVHVHHRVQTAAPHPGHSPHRCQGHRGQHRRHRPCLPQANSRHAGRRRSSVSERPIHKCQATPSCLAFSV